MSFWKSLFGGKGADTSGPKTVGAAEHKGFRIEAQPYAEGGQYQAAGVISKEIDGEVKTHRFVRADRFPTIEDAAEFVLMKGRQIIDQQGTRIFD